VVAQSVLPRGTLFRAVLPDQAPTALDAVADRGAGSRWRRWSDAAALDDRDVQPTQDADVDGIRPRALDDVAAVIWRLLDGPRSVADLLEALTAHQHEACAERGPRDVAQLLSDVVASGSARRVEG
jgi:hypothetical protein